MFPQERERYSRNALLAQVGWEGQARWGAGRVLVVGAGGIGSTALLYLAAAGVGRLGLVDGDHVELSNLQRQIIHRTPDLGRRKVASAAGALAALNPHCRVETFDLQLRTPAQVREVAQGFEVVLDASDNFPTRFLVAECCWRQGLPLVSAAATGWHGQLLVARPGAENPCYRCLLPEPPPAAVPAGDTAGILGAVAGVMGCLQAVETLKLLLGRESDLTRRLLAYDGLQGRFQTVSRVKKPDCELCGTVSSEQ
ncbi:MAG: HesA/MoeB/ThiF family protein [Desulfobaccales bacterium]